MSGSAAGEQKAVAAPAYIGRGRVAAAIAVLVLILAGTGFYFWRSHASANIDSLAVLPFVNMGGSADADWLSDGITESLIDSLSGLPNLKVMSRRASFRYKGKDADPARRRPRSRCARIACGPAYATWRQPVSERGAGEGRR